MYVYICVYIHRHVYVYIYIYIYTYIYIYIYTHIYMFVFVCAYMYILYHMRYINILYNTFSVVSKFMVKYSGCGSFCDPCKCQSRGILMRSSDPVLQYVLKIDRSFQHDKS